VKARWAGSVVVIEGNPESRIAAIERRVRVVVTEGAIEVAIEQ
jgi:hypothetical protein